ncbi:helix-turn-helix transcriptional regulator [Desemzia incerta]|uniref:helix-turn-helix transcriptional regulator n=1 Tax=Desemzia incerta TaxID=82801 RepID=UPI001660265A|nr:helix-turn-helix domain-containing protein [Desemzia incerta]
MDIGKRLKQKRQEANLTQKELADLLFVSRQTISSWEVGRTYPDLETLVKISELFATPLDDLLKEDSQVIKDISEKVKKSERRKITSIILAVLLLIVTSTSIIYGIKQYQHSQLNAHINQEGLKPNDLLNSTWEMNYTPLDELQQSILSFDEKSLVLWNNRNYMANITLDMEDEEISEIHGRWLEMGLVEGIATYEDVTIEVKGDTYIVSAYGYSQEFTKLSDTIIQDSNGIEYFKVFSNNTHDDLYSLAESMTE